MSNKIGDYIHWSYQNYLDYGLAVRLPQKENIDPLRELNKHKNKMKKDLKLYKNKYGKNSKVISDLEERLNFIFNPKDVNPTIKPDGLTKKDIDSIHQTVQKKLEKRLNGARVSEKTLSVIKNGEWGTYADNLAKVNAQLVEEIRDTGVNIGKKDKARYASVKERIELIRKAYESINPEDTPEEINGQITNLLNEWSKIDEQRKQGSTKLITNKTFLDNLKSIYKRLYVSTDTIQGDYAELVSVAANYVVNKGTSVGLDELLQILNDFDLIKKNSLKSQKGVATDFISSRFTANSIIKGNSSHRFYGKDDTLNFKEGFFTSYATDDKIDLFLTYNDKAIPISLKNYNMNKIPQIEDIHLLSGRSVLGLTQEYTDFLNHYMNLIPRAGKNNNRLINKYYKAKDIMKLTILVKALVGGVYTRQGRSGEAEFFIINDNSQGKYRVFNMYDIVRKIEENMELLKTGDFDKRDIIATYYNKDGGPDMFHARKRISDILHELHIMKLNVSIDKSVFYDSSTGKF